VAFPQLLGGRLELTERGRRAGAIRQVERRLRRYAAGAADPFLARRRTGYCPAAEYPDAALLGRQAVLRWIPAAAVVCRLAAHQYEQRARLGRALAARLVAEPASPAAVSAAESLVPLAGLLE
jgi:hypothetical protein